MSLLAQPLHATIVVSLSPPSIWHIHLLFRRAVAQGFWFMWLFLWWCPYSCSCYVPDCWYTSIPIYPDPSRLPAVSHFSNPPWKQHTIDIYRSYRWLIAWVGNIENGSFSTAGTLFENQRMIVVSGPLGGHSLPKEGLTDGERSSKIRVACFEKGNINVQKPCVGVNHVFFLFMQSCFLHYIMPMTWLAKNHSQLTCQFC